MRRLALVFADLSTLALAGAAGSKVVAVSITKAGYVPSALTIVQGDTGVSYAAGLSNTIRS